MLSFELLTTLISLLLVVLPMLLLFEVRLLDLVPKKVRLSALLLPPDIPIAVRVASTGLVFLSVNKFDIFY
jgi:hypothetical protein